MLVATDLEAFELCSLFEALVLDEEDVRLSLMHGTAFPDEHDSVRCLGEMLKVIDRGDYHPLWKDLPGDSLQHGRTFDFCKAALIKADVEITCKEKHVDVLLDDLDERQPGVASRTDGAVDQDAQGPEHNHRDDLSVCALLTLGNLLRHGVCSILPSLQEAYSSFRIAGIDNYKENSEPLPALPCASTPSSPSCHRTLSPTHQH